MNSWNEARQPLSPPEPDTEKRLRDGTLPAEEDLSTAALRARLESAGRSHLPGALDELHACVLEYFARQLSMRDDPGHLQTTAKNLVWTFWALADLEPVPTETLVELKQMLGVELRAAEDGAREILVTHCLEPLFESRRMAAMFADWEEDRQLRDVYQRALAWGEGFWPQTRGG
ncbi:MAG: hypothetical protein K6U02_12460 [Firmicutes bacterium]|nr:hypothetical protein [Bacillota bacterium]